MRFLACILLARVLSAQIAFGVFGGLGPVIPPAQPWITSSSGATRTGFPEYYATAFSMTATKTVTALGRLCYSGNSLTHTLLVTTGASDTLASVVVNMAGCTPGTFVYGTVSLTLANGVTYYVVTDETVSAGADSYAVDSALTVTGVASSVGAYYSSQPNNSFINLTGAGTGAGPANFQYQ